MRLILIDDRQVQQGAYTSLFYLLMFELYNKLQHGLTL
nr:MAG TPA: hypothetical protein [Caudoviricetes sp.]